MSQGSRSYSPQKSESNGEHLRVLVGMSGGIHSAVTAALLKTQGHEVVGVYLELKVPAAFGSIENHCISGNARGDAEKAAQALGVELHIEDASELYQACVLETVVHQASLGNSPNPCVACNRQVKLASLFRKASELRCDKVATGHGAQLGHDPRTGIYQLLQAGDIGRDQSAFLFTLTQEELSMLLLPLGNFPKAMVNRLGAEYGFAPATSASQAICFSDAAATQSFVESRLAAALRPKGVIRALNGQILGEHSGLHRHRFGEHATFGLLDEQSKGLVVVDIDLSSNALVMGSPDSLFKKECVVFGTHCLKPLHQLKGVRCLARIRPDGASFPCQLTFFENQIAHVEFDERQGPLFPGQAIVFYQDNEVLGGGWIRTTS